MGEALITRRGGGGGKPANAKEINGYSINPIDANNFVNLNDDGRDYSTVIPIDSSASASGNYGTGTLPFILPLTDERSLLFYNTLKTNKLMVCVCIKTSSGVTKGTSLTLTDFVSDIYSTAYVVSKNSVLKLSGTKILLAVNNPDSEKKSKVIVLDINETTITKKSAVIFSGYVNLGACTMLRMDDTHVVITYGKSSTNDSLYNKYVSVLTIVDDTVSLLVEKKTSVYASEDTVNLKMVIDKADANTAYALTSYNKRDGTTLLRIRIDYDAANIAFTILNIDTGSNGAASVNCVKVLNASKLLIAYIKTVSLENTSYYVRAYSIVNVTASTLSVIETKICNKDENEAIKVYSEYSSFTNYSEGNLYEISNGNKFFDLIHCPYDDVFRYSVLEIDLANVAITMWGDTIYSYSFNVLYENIKTIVQSINKNSSFDNSGVSSLCINPKLNQYIATDLRNYSILSNTYYFFTYYRFEIDEENNKVLLNYAYKLTNEDYGYKSACSLMHDNNNVSFAFIARDNSSDNRFSFNVIMTTPDNICADNIKLLDTDNIFLFGITKDNIPAKNIGKLYIKSM